MQIKIILIGFLVGSSYLIGEYIYRVFINRHKQIKRLINILEFIRMDITFGMYTLEEIFSHIASKENDSYSRFFNKLSISLRNDECSSLEEIIEKNKAILAEDSYLSTKEIGELKSLILNLGQSDVDSQQRVIEGAIESFKSQTFEAKEDITKKGMLYKKLVTFVGIGICIILV